MTKSPIPLRVDDLTHFARAMSRQLGENSPSHLSLMNMLARSAGFQNVQHMRAATAAARRLAQPAQPAMADARTVERALHQFDAQGRLRQWPSKRATQSLALWALWATLPAGRALSERQVNDALAAQHLFDDVATLRRTMIAEGLMTRKSDGSEYRRIEQKPSPEARTVIHALSRRRQSR
ncbi:hypothetical protein ACMU_09545 [Actibacterium mucosum KCTC 23349]|uniref:DUF2087 domain-containing protein n=1 Tax=Actibacterium mucosum KCTC 23349 TaxID=1454373 RepID=A0A037ZIR8_9RHOB|nr:DUF2087 domain-containing protein [Actibacterium mucosum]KAJ55998.1 hypothetical protein ACMU_09545 [Actibacterium mucosum KCTC 23349]